jgi:hypothetical protein
MMDDYYPGDEPETEEKMKLKKKQIKRKIEVPQSPMLVVQDVVEGLDLDDRAQIQHIVDLQKYYSDTRKKFVEAIRLNTLTHGVTDVAYLLGTASLTAVRLLMRGIIKKQMGVLRSVRGDANQLQGVPGVTEANWPFLRQMGFTDMLRDYALETQEVIGFAPGTQAVEEHRMETDAKASTGVAVQIGGGGGKEETGGGGKMKTAKKKKVAKTPLAKKPAKPASEPRPVEERSEEPEFASTDLEDNPAALAELRARWADDIRAMAELRADGQADYMRTHDDDDDDE